ncbi:MAG: glutaredoxin 3 [Gammaproteobacteria bacterium]|nr:glutaredoxin 3 [Gammaproteobacteria bacterium]
MAPEIIVYAMAACPYCAWAKRLLNAKGVEFDVRSVDGRPDLWAEVEDRTGRSTVPQIFIGDYHVGGYDDLSALERDGRLDSLLFPAS